MMKIADVAAVLAAHSLPIFKIILSTGVIWLCVSAGYNIFLHPLRKYPGPILQRAISLPWAIQNAIGNQAFCTQRLHDQYGPIVRISPNHLSFTQVEAWKDIYGFQPPSNRRSSSSFNSRLSTEMPKSKIFANTVEELPTSISNADHEEHKRLRRALAHGFSDVSMRDQEGMILTYVDKLVSRLADFSQDGAGPLNIEAWYNWATFDVAGDLIFAQSFRCLDRADYHPWIAFVLGAIRFGAVMTSLKYIGLGPFVHLLFKMGGMRAMSKVRNNTDEMLRDRMSMKHARNDLLEGLVKRSDEWNLSFDKLSANAFILTLAGSETTATTLSGATYFLLKHPEVHEKLKEEVRSSFKNAREININSVSKLSYMIAVLNESLRMYPPVTSGLVREVPLNGGNIALEHVPGGILVEIQQWSSNHSPDNWTKPWEFIPERFMDDDLSSQNRLDSLQAFSVGPRNCIGRNLAYAEMRLVLARIIFEFDLSPGEGNDAWIERQRAFSLWDRVPLIVYLKPVVR